MIIVLDTNIWISLALNQQLDFIEILNSKEIVIASCDQLLDELVTVLLRPKFRKYFSNNHIEDLVHFHELTTILFKVSNITQVVTDEKDNYLFALCKSAKADYFITGDKLLLNVDKYDNSSIITLSTFKTIFESL
ncbi:MAG: putative toxin-antitoxin system toxin component, family [Mucilaginibacter sp.]|uniref:putative toxin-antitoxin system toxin component, PIN family n=1 Tax=Mucilaginibacter sp. TaxID=1882438 RepID=UPI00262AFD82|nr:putative toxin-antitoxin system toxin component, PIN family [Mucilaginibacter sp.]MDB5001794.1 putative toxin-antitoxin system toxin component, family [Mucilaginibacter sp.]